MCVPSWLVLRPGLPISPRFEEEGRKKNVPITLLLPHVGPPPVSSGRFSHRYITSGVWFCAPVMRLLFHHESSYIFAVALAGPRALFTPPPSPPPFLCFALLLTRGLFTRNRAVCGCNGVTAHFSGCFPICSCWTYLHCSNPSFVSWLLCCWQAWRSSVFLYTTFVPSILFLRTDFTRLSVQGMPDFESDMLICAALGRA